MQNVAAKILADFLARIQQAGIWHADNGLISAVSGGPDSLGLALVAAAYADAHACRHKVLIIDHKLRPASTEQAQATAQILRARGIKTQIKQLPASPPTTGLQAYARAHRLDYLADAARPSALVLFAHHRGDQAETVALRLETSSSLHGLAGIAALRYYKGVLFGRPFLTLDKADLAEVPRHAGLTPIEDPSNANPAFRRVAYRQHFARAPQLARNLLRLQLCAAHVSDRLEGQIDDWIAQHVTHYFRLQLYCPLAAFNAESAGTRYHLLRRLLAMISASAYPPATKAIDRLRARLESGQGGTLSGCVLYIAGKNLVIMAEAGRPPPPILPIKAGQWAVFDKRWLVYSQIDGVIKRAWQQSGRMVGRMDCEGQKHPQKSHVPPPPTHLPPAPYRPRQMRALMPILHSLDNQVINAYLRSRYDAKILPKHLSADHLSWGLSRGLSRGSSWGHPFMVWPLICDGRLHTLDFAGQIRHVSAR